MEMTVKENTDLMIQYLGGAGNIVSVNNCMTRLRVNVRDDYNDLNWACGWHLHDDERKYISKWRGKNLLGFALMAVREQIRAEMEEDSENSSVLFATSQGR